MIRGSYLLLALAGVAGAALAMPTQALPPVLARVSPGMWELSGIAGRQIPERVCLRDLMALARVEHRHRACKMDVVSSTAGSTVVSYTCSPGNFGNSQIDLVTPRSLRIGTQGISGNLPFAYVVLARRIGDCPTIMPIARH